MSSSPVPKKNADKPVDIIMGTLVEKPGEAETRAGKPLRKEPNKNKPKLHETLPQALPSTAKQDSAITLQPVDEANLENNEEKMPQQIGKYRLTRRLGSGGMGEVYLAHDSELDRLVALKLTKFSSSDSDLRERFRREARAVASLRHLGLCPVYDVGQTGDGRDYMALAYVEGGTLADFIDKRGAQAPRKAAGIVRRIAQAMAVAHTHGVLHRDLKPANILLDKKLGEPVVTDFGLAKKVTPDHGCQGNSSITVSGTILGTPAYMPPEQLDGDIKKLGPACDIYALGVILYEILSGKRPFNGHYGTLLAKVMTEQPPALPDSVPTPLSIICMKALAKKPEDRFASMTDFANALTSFINSQVGTGAEPSVFHEIQNIAIETRTRLASVKLATQQQKRPLFWLATGLATLLIFMISGIIFYFSTAEGTLKIELSDPKAKVSIAIDGKTLQLTHEGMVHRLRPGRHKILVQGQGFETKSEDFSIKRGDITVLKVTPEALKPDFSKSQGINTQHVANMSESNDSNSIPASKIENTAPVYEALAKKELAPVVLTKEQLIINNLEKAKEFSSSKKYNDCILYCNKVLELDQYNTFAICLRAYTNQHIGKFDIAIVDHTTAIKKGGCPEFSQGLGNVDCLYGNRGWCQYNLGNYEEAIADSTRAIALGNNYYMRDRINAYIRSGKYDDAISDITEFVEKEPNNANHLFQRASVHAKRLDPEAAAIDRAAAAKIDIKSI
ncbi:MAG: protein kinase [Planctomycetia bacterium]|nr:protein kinase [Planctomycetia bacterium]